MTYKVKAFIAAVCGLSRHGAGEMIVSRRIHLIHAHLHTLMACAGARFEH